VTFLCIITALLKFVTAVKLVMKAVAISWFDFFVCVCVYIGILFS